MLTTSSFFASSDSVLAQTEAAQRAQQSNVEPQQANEQQAPQAIDESDVSDASNDASETEERIEEQVEVQREEKDPEQAFTPSEEIVEDKAVSFPRDI